MRQLKKCKTHCLTYNLFYLRNRPRSCKRTTSSLIARVRDVLRASWIELERILQWLWTKTSQAKSTGQPAVSYLDMSDLQHAADASCSAATDAILSIYSTLTPSSPSLHLVIATTSSASTLAFYQTSTTPTSIATSVLPIPIAPVPIGQSDHFRTCTIFFQIVPSFASYYSSPIFGHHLQNPPNPYQLISIFHTGSHPAHEITVSFVAFMLVYSLYSTSSLSPHNLSWTYPSDNCRYLLALKLRRGYSAIFRGLFFPEGAEGTCKWVIELLENSCKCLRKIDLYYVRLDFHFPTTLLLEHSQCNPNKNKVDEFSIALDFIQRPFR